MGMCGDVDLDSTSPARQRTPQSRATSHLDREHQGQLAS
nr:hypothetical protein [Kibdelosporangium sp. MJ126-NF4]CTQ89611.1 hypothetical protein [Kibdelosporangium sp. MJ126-NF4]